MLIIHKHVASFSFTKVQDFALVNQCKLCEFMFVFIKRLAYIYGLFVTLCLDVEHKHISIIIKKQERNKGVNDLIQDTIKLGPKKNGLYSGGGLTIELR